MIEPKAIAIARRGALAIAALALLNAGGKAVVRAFVFSNELVPEAASSALGMLGVSGGAHINVDVFIWDVPDSMQDAQVVARFAALVGDGETEHLYRLINANGGRS